MISKIFILVLIFLFAGRGFAQIESRPLTDEATTSPEYQEYFFYIQKRIQRAAYQAYDVLDHGTISLEFEVFRNGKLNWVKVIDEKNLASDSIRKSAIKALKKAAPFKNFPKNLAKQHSTLIFSITLNFQIQDNPATELTP